MYTAAENYTVHCIIHRATTKLELRLYSMPVRSFLHNQILSKHLLLSKSLRTEVFINVSGNNDLLCGCWKRWEDKEW